jgi:DNA-binding CsgD family transcriptional regulator
LTPAPLIGPLETDGYTAALPAIRAGEALLHDDTSVDEMLWWSRHAVILNAALWDPDGYDAEDRRRAQLAREAGALTVLRLILISRSLVLPWMGDLAGAAALVAEVESIGTAIRAFVSQVPAARLHGLTGDEEELGKVVAATADFPHGSVVVHVHHAVAVLNNGLGNVEQAMVAALEARAARFPVPGLWGLPELIEEAVRSRLPDVARAALTDLVETTQLAGNDVALGLEARCRALLDEDDAESCYLDALERLGRTSLRTELARTHLLSGEWLRRRGRRTDARQHLRSAHDQFVTIGMRAFAERARRELAATGETVRKREDNRLALTPQEAQITRLARDGLTNPDIGAQLFISARTVEGHLHNAFTKLGITNRRQLQGVPVDGGQLIDNGHRRQ